MRSLRIGMLVSGILLGFVALGLVLGGGGLVVAHAALREADGFYAVGSHSFDSPGHAVTSGDLDLGDVPAEWFPSGLATVRIDATSDADVFLGIAPRWEAERYLAGVSHSVVTDIEDRPYRVTYGEVSGTLTPAPPAEQDFWAASSSGSDGELTWEPQRGDWVVVAMNADGSEGVDVELAAGVKTGLLLPMGVGMLVLGFLATGGATTLVVLAARGDRSASGASSTTGPAQPDVG